MQKQPLQLCKILKNKKYPQWPTIAWVIFTGMKINYEESLSFYRKAIRLNPDDVEAKINFELLKNMLSENSGDESQEQEFDSGNDESQEQESSKTAVATNRRSKNLRTAVATNRRSKNLQTAVATNRRGKNLQTAVTTNRRSKNLQKTLIMNQ